MKTRIIIIALSAVLALVIGLALWRSAHPVRPKYVVMKKAPPAPAARKKPAMLPSVTKKVANPKVAVVMDDFGYNMNNLDSLFNIRKPITLSVLPNLPYSREISGLARSKGYEVILHLPLEPERKDVREEAGTIRSGMADKEIISRLEEDIGSVGMPSGVSNHMGSKATEEKTLMAVIIGSLKKHGLYFFDSLTSRKTVCQEVARSFGVRYAKRDVFLDLPNDPEHIRHQVLELRRVAFKRGRAIAVCHDRKNTIKILAEMMPELSAEGIKFVYLSELVN